MSDYRLAPDAAQDLEAITDYVAKVSPTGAVTVLESLLDHFQFLAEFPGAGESRPAMGKVIRVTAEGMYVIYFRPIPTGVEIARVVHGSRDIQSLE